MMGRAMMTAEVLAPGASARRREKGAPGGGASVRLSQGVLTRASSSKSFLAGRRASASPAGSDESFDSADFVREYDPANQAATEDVGRMTARQRAKAGLQAEEDAAGDGLLELPAELPARDVKQRGLSEMEKQRKREENARKRKLLSDQKQEEEKVRAARVVSSASDGLVAHTLGAATDRHDQPATPRAIRPDKGKDTAESAAGVPGRLGRCFGHARRW